MGLFSPKLHFWPHEAGGHSARQRPPPGTRVPSGGPGSGRAAGGGHQMALRRWGSCAPPEATGSLGLPRRAPGQGWGVAGAAQAWGRFLFFKKGLWDLGPWFPATAYI